MGVESFVTCDADGCNSRVQTPQPGAVPPSWVMLRFAKPVIPVAGQRPEPGKPAGGLEQVAMIFCSWKCMMHFVQSMTRGEQPASK